MIPSHLTTGFPDHLDRKGGQDQDEGVDGAEGPNGIRPHEEGQIPGAAWRAAHFSTWKNTVHVNMHVKKGKGIKYRTL